MKLSQKGFAVLEALLILIIIAIIGGTLWYVVNSRNDIYQAYDSTSDSSVKPPKSKGSLFAFKELGVQITLPSTGELSKLSFITEGGNVQLSTPELSAAINKCNGVANDPGVTFDVLTKNEGQYDSGKSGFNTVLLKQFPNFWIGGASAISGVTCSDSGDRQTLDTLYTATEKALVDAFKNAALVQ
jgi:hypothetical protein